MKLTQKILLNLIILILTCCYCKILLLICCGDSCVDSHTSGRKAACNEPVDKARKQGLLKQSQVAGHCGQVHKKSRMRRHL